MKKIPLPREHGAWFMLATPLLLGGGLAPRWDASLCWLLVAALGVFLARHPLATLLKIRKHPRKDAQRRWLRRWLVLYSTPAMLAFGWLLLGKALWGLLPLALLASICLAVDLWLVTLRRSMSLHAELIGVCGLALSAPMAYYAACGQLDSKAFGLGLLNALYFAGSIFYVKLKVRYQARNPAPSALSQRLHVARSSLLYHICVMLAVTALSALSWLPAWTPLAFVPFALKALWGSLSWQDKHSLNLKRLGIIEGFHTLAFCLLTTATFL